MAKKREAHTQENPALPHSDIQVAARRKSPGSKPAQQPPTNSRTLPWTTGQGASFLHPGGTGRAGKWTWSPKGCSSRCRAWHQKLWG